MGIIPNAELQTSHAPFAQAAGLAVRTPAMIIIAARAVLKSFGSLGGWKRPKPGNEVSDHER